MKLFSKDIHPAHESAPGAPTASRISNRKDREAQTRPRRFLAVAADGPCHAILKAYALQLSRRIPCDEVVLLAIAESDRAATEHAGKDRDKAASPWALPELVPLKAANQEGLIECRVRPEELVSTVDRLCREIKRIEFILTDSEATLEILSEKAGVPVFRIAADATLSQGGCDMSTHSSPIRKKPVGKTIVLGVLTAALYAAVFWKADVLMKSFTRGGVYAVLPIATAIAFSFAHGAFASNLWSLLGIHARPKTEAYKTVSPSAPAPKVKPKRPRVYAYVNPFHNIELKKK
jgi:hypothetical protein